MRLAGATVAHQDVHSAEGRLGLTHQLLTLPDVGDIGLHGDRAPAHGRDLAANLARFVPAGVVVDHHVGTGPRQYQRNGGADAAPATGDQRHPAGQVN